MLWAEESRLIGALQASRALEFSTFLQLLALRHIQVIKV